MSFETLCEDCGHRKVAHIDTEQPTGVGSCHHGYAGAECQCPAYARPDHEGSDIRDVNNQSTQDTLWRDTARHGAITPEEARRFINMEYDTGTDSLVIPNEGKLENADSANKTIDAADRIIMINQDNADGMYSIENTTASSEPLDITRTSINSMSPAPNVQDGDVWTPRPGLTLIRLDGEWFDPDEYNKRINQKREADENDPVNHPSHYTAYPGIEVIQLTRWLGFNKGNAVKYIARAGLKSEEKKIEDLEKAIWYLKDELALLRGDYGVFEG